MSRLSATVRSLGNRVNSQLYRPRVTVQPAEGLVRLGSVYGGWTIAVAPYLEDSVIVSCGLGEDASFDIEAAARFGAKVMIVDPTPRAVVHFEAITAELGSPASTGYVPGGRQPVASYDLSRIRPGQLELIPKAIWTSNEPVRFHKPENPDHVSHSIKFATSGEDDSFIIVPTTTINDLLADIPQERFSILKMDIEGAEIDILDSIGSWRALPRQILVEFDVLRHPGPASKREVKRVDALLTAAGYACRHWDGHRNYLYVR